jgi:hypothetical protein
MIADETAAIAPELDVAVAAICTPGLASDQGAIRATRGGLLRTAHFGAGAIPTCSRLLERCDISIALDGSHFGGPTTVLLTSYGPVPRGQHFSDPRAVSLGFEDAANKETPALVARVLVDTLLTLNTGDRDYPLRRVHVEQRKHSGAAKP